VGIEGGSKLTSWEVGTLLSRWICGLKGGKSKGWKVGLKRRSQGVKDLSSSYKFNNVVCNIILSFIKVIIME
jgi:hypothetical protein